MQRLERAVPPDHPLVHVHHRQPGVERLQHVLVELPHPAQFFGLHVQLAVEPAVLQRGRGLPRHRREQCQVLGVQRLGVRLAPERQHGNRRLFRHARDEVVQLAVAPRRKVRRRNPVGRDVVVQRNDGPGGETGTQRGGALEAHRRIRQPGRPNRRELLRPLLGQEQRHPIDQQRLRDPNDDPIAEPVQIEVGTQVAGEPDQRPPIVVPVAVERAVERGLDGVLQRPGDQHHHDRRQQRDDRGAVARVRQEQPARHLEQHRVDRGDACQRSGPDQPALDDDLDVGQAVPHDRARERERDQAERNGRQLHRQRGLDPHRVRQGVAEREGQPPERGAPRHPAQLPPRGDRPHLAERARDDHQPRAQVHRQVERLEPVERLHDLADVEPPVADGARDGREARDAEQQRRQVHELPEPAAERAGGPRPRTLRKEEREVQEERRQQEHRRRVGPVEEPVEPVEPAAEREGCPAEEGRREPEEMQRRRMIRPAQANGGSDEQREQTDRRQDVVEARVPARDRGQPELEGLGRSEPEQPIGDRLPLRRSTQEGRRRRTAARRTGRQSPRAGRPVGSPPGPPACQARRRKR